MKILNLDYPKEISENPNFTFGYLNLANNRRALASFIKDLVPRT